MGVCSDVSPFFLLDNLWGFIRGLDKVCHHLARTHTRKSPMLHCGQASFMQRGRSHVYRHTPTQFNTKEAEHSLPIYRKMAITFYHAGLRSDRAARYVCVCVSLYLLIAANTWTQFCHGANLLILDGSSGHLQQSVTLLVQRLATHDNYEHTLTLKPPLLLFFLSNPYLLHFESV